jgi:hypothetical protein
MLPESNEPRRPPLRAELWLWLARLLDKPCREPGDRAEVVSALTALALLEAPRKK